MIFKSFVIIIHSLAVRGQGLISLATSKAAIDTGVDDIPTPRKLIETKNINIDGEDSLYKMFLFQRVKIDFDTNSTIALHYGMDPELFRSTASLPFHIDIEFNHVLINMNSHECVDEENCHKINEGKRDTHVYNGTSYTYFNATSFLGVNRVRSGEITVEKSEDIANLYTLPIRFYDNIEGLSRNVLGLGPNSPAWEYWKRAYHFPAKHINITLSYNSDNEYMLYNSYINRDNEIMFALENDKDKPNQLYMFKATLTFKSTKINFEGFKNVCLSSKDNLMMRVSQPILNDLRSELCKEPAHCVKITDLKPNPEINIGLTMADSLNPERKFNTKLFRNAIYEIEDGNIKWKVEGITPSDYNAECDIILEKEFLKEKYLLLSYGFSEPATMHVGFKLVLPSDSSRVDSYLITIIVLSIATVALFIAYMFIDYSLGKMIEKQTERLKAE